MDKCNKKNCPMQFDKVPDDCDIKDCPYRTTDKDDNWEIASKFFGMILGISEEQRKEWTEKSKNDYYANKEIEGE